MIEAALVEQVTWHQSGDRGSDSARIGAGLGKFENRTVTVSRREEYSFC